MESETVSEAEAGIKDYRDVKLDGYALPDEILTIRETFAEKKGGARRIVSLALIWNNKGRIIGSAGESLCGVKSERAYDGEQENPLAEKYNHALEREF